MESSTPADHDDETPHSASEEEAEPEPEHSGHVHPAETTAEGFTVTDDSGVLNSDPVTLLTSSVSVTLSPPSAEVDASSPEIITFIPESNASSEAGPVEDIQDKQEQEGLGESPEVFLSTTQNITDGDPEEREQDGGEGSGESSGEGPQVRRGFLLTTLSTDHTSSEGADGEAGTDTPPESEVKITLIPHLTLTPGWEAEPPSSAPQESRSDREYSAEPPVTEESDDVTTEREVVTEITSSSIDGERT